MLSAAKKLIDVAEQNADKIAVQWFVDVRKNPRTPSYHDLSESRAVPMAVEFYQRFRSLFDSDKPFEQAKKIFAVYADDCLANDIPLQEAIYALTLMRRHMWLYAEFQAIFTTAIEQRQAIESINRTILLFDYAIYVITQRYHDRLKGEIQKQLGALRALGMEETFTGSKVGIMMCLLIACGFLTYYYHTVMSSGVIFTHLFYIPIVLAGLWWRKQGIFVSVILAVILIVSHLIFMKGVPLTDDLIRAVMFVVVSTVVALLAEGLTRVEVLYKTPARI
ncbi:MAG TPA: hypothetical protein VMB77_04535 [Syntrophales bacterium]|nr:hypothetical protein [Syntrophales bacterium]